MAACEKKSFVSPNKGGWRSKTIVRDTLKSKEKQGAVIKTKGPKNSWVYTLVEEEDDEDEPDDLSAE